MTPADLAPASLPAVALLALAGSFAACGSFRPEGDDDSAAEPTPVPVRFAALGDTGEGNEDQYRVSEAMKTVCDTRGCDFVLLLGDNAYDSGVESATDPYWDTIFELPYAAFDIPFYASLGNHDYGLDGLGLEPWKADYQVEHTDYSTIWTMPDRYYSFVAEDVAFFALDTNAAFWYVTDDQRDDMEAWIAAAPARWKVAFGHHPYYSNGEHGDAGNYEGLWFVPIANGGGVEEFVGDVVCGKVDLYLCGHDHSRQYLVDTCDGTELIVSGAGAKTTELPGERPVWFQAEREGFFWLEIVGDQLTVATYDLDGVLEYERTRLKTE